MYVDVDLRFGWLVILVCLQFLLHPVRRLGNRHWVVFRTQAANQDDYDYHNQNDSTTANIEPLLVIAPEATQFTCGDQVSVWVNN